MRICLAKKPQHCSCLTDGFHDTSRWYNRSGSVTLSPHYSDAVSTCETPRPIYGASDSAPLMSRTKPLESSRGSSRTYYWSADRRANSPNVRNTASMVNTMSPYRWPEDFYLPSPFPAVSRGLYVSTIDAALKRYSHTPPW